MDDQIAISSDSVVSDDDSEGEGIINTKVNRLPKTKVIKKETPSPMIFKVSRAGRPRIHKDGELCSRCSMAVYGRGEMVKGMCKKCYGYVRGK